MKVEVLSRAKKQLKKLPKLDQFVIVNKINSLSRKDVKLEKLKDFKNIYRARAGNYRIIIKRTKTRMVVVIIGHRREVYNLAERLLR